MNWDRIFFVHHGIVSAVKTVEFFSDRMSYKFMRGRRCDINVVNVHAQVRSKVMTNNNVL